MREHERRAATRSVVLRGADDEEEYVVRVEPAPRFTFFMRTPRRIWNTLTRNRNWWVTVESNRVAWPVLREHFPTEREAKERAEDLAKMVDDRSWTPADKPASRRRRGPTPLESRSG